MIKYNNPNKLHPFLCSMLAYNDYDHNDDPYTISVTALMKPTHMVALERFNCKADKTIELDALIPSVLGSSVHSLMEVALPKTTPEEWKQFGVSEPDKLEIKQEIRKTRKVGKYTVSGKFDIMYRYNESPWALLDLKTMSVWALMLDPVKKKKEFSKQLGMYKWINVDDVIQDTGEILFWYTDWSKMESIRNAKYPKSRVGTFIVELAPTDEVDTYIKDKLNQLDKAIESLKLTADDEYPSTGTKCSEEDLWMSPTVWKYYKNPTKLARATKNFDNFGEAQARLAQDGNVGKVIKVDGSIKRCNYCSVSAYCEDYIRYKTLGFIKEI